MPKYGFPWGHRSWRRLHACSGCLEVDLAGLLPSNPKNSNNFVARVLRAKKNLRNCTHETRPRPDTNINTEPKRIAARGASTQD